VAFPRRKTVSKPKSSELSLAPSIIAPRPCVLDELFVQDGGKFSSGLSCACLQRQNKPFCSGMHWYVQLRDPESVT
jgi:hypothetical protein